MSKIWLTSDYHFDHNNILKYCPNRAFTSVQEMNETLVSNWNTNVLPDDTVYFLGDFSMNYVSVQKYLPILNGKKILVSGNHDLCHRAHKKSKNIEHHFRWKQEYERAGFSVVADTLNLMLLDWDLKFKLNHLPYYDPTDVQNGTIRYKDFRPLDNGQPLLCGHVHQHWLFKFTPNGTIQINVGIDSPGAPWSNQNRPASLDEVMDVYWKAMYGHERVLEENARDLEKSQRDKNSI